MERPQKIVIISANNIRADSEMAQVDCFSWSYLGRFPGIHDYDTVILDVLDVVNEAKIDWQQFSRHFTFGAMWDVFIGGGRIIILGNPRHRWSMDDADIVRQMKLGDSALTLCNWTGMEFLWDERGGTTVEFTMAADEEDQYGSYLSLLKRWSYSLRDVRLTSEYARFSPDGDVNSMVVLDKALFPLAKTRNGSVLAGSVYLNLFPQSLNNAFEYSSADRSEQIGPLVLLPDVGIGSEQSLRIILHDVCGINVVRSEPAWVQKTVAPKQKTLDEEIFALNQQIEQAHELLLELESNRAAIRQVLRLLYEQHNPLEVEVRNTVRALGADVHDPVGTNEDGWLEVMIDGRIRYAVIETKGTKNDQHEMKGVRQLEQWKDEAERDRKIEHHGLFFGNSAINKPLNERPDPFPDNWVKTARNNEICAMTTETLYRAYELEVEGTLDREAFWRTVFSTNGVFTGETLQKLTK